MPEPKAQADVAYDRLRADILGGALQPGTKLKLEALRGRYDVSINTLRETLSRLSADGLVEAEGQRGFTVMPASLADLIDITADAPPARVPRRAAVGRARRSRMGVAPGRGLSQAVQGRGTGGQGGGQARRSARELQPRVPHRADLGLQFALAAALPSHDVRPEPALPHAGVPGEEFPARPVAPRAQADPGSGAGARRRRRWRRCSERTSPRAARCMPSTRPKAGEGPRNAKR